MKKIFLIFIFVIFFVACETKPNYQEILSEFSNTIVLPEFTDTDLDIKTSYLFKGYEIIAEWKSSNEDIINNEGKITKTFEENLVSLELKISLNDSTIYKTFDIFVEAIDKSEIANEILNLIEVPSETDKNITLQRYVTYNDIKYSITWDSNDTTIISNKGIITYNNEDKSTFLTAYISFEGEKFSRKFEILVKAFDTSIMVNFLEDLWVISKISEDIALPTEVSHHNYNFDLIWESSNPEILNNTGKVGICIIDTTVNLSVTMKIGNAYCSKTYSILVQANSNDQILEIIDKTIFIPKLITNDYFLPTDFGNNILGSWTSSDNSIMSNEGKIIQSITKPTDITLTLNVKIGENNMTKTYETKIHKEEHFLMHNTFDGTFENVELNNNGKIVLSQGKTEGTYFSNEIDYSNFSEVVATWCATSSTVATCELFISLKVNDTYSDYITYGKWGLGLKNGSRDQQNSLIKLADDEVKVLNNKYANGLKYKIILRRNKVTDISPEVSLITFAFNLANYTFDFDHTLLKKSVKYDVPKLYQHDVPSIGNSICSITSSTMLLKFKGYDFTDKDSLEHQYLAGLFKDYGNNIFGNWVFNCVGMSAYGERAYVKRFFNTNEFLYSLQEIGPMAASIKGTVKYEKQENGQKGSYSTAGHLLVVTGYEITDNNTFIYINDPNVNGVAIKLTLEDFLNVWRNVSYIIE